MFLFKYFFYVQLLFNLIKCSPCFSCYRLPPSPFGTILLYLSLPLVRYYSTLPSLWYDITLPSSPFGMILLYPPLHLQCKWLHGVFSTLTPRMAERGWSSDEDNEYLLPPNIHPDFPLPDPRPPHRDYRHRTDRHYLLRYRHFPNDPNDPPVYSHFLTEFYHPYKLDKLSDLGDSLDSDTDSIEDAPITPPQHCNRTTSGRNILP